VREVYMDNVAAKPLLEEVVRGMSPYMTRTYGNPQSLHRFGEGPAQALEEAREKVARLVGPSAQEIYFTASGSESNNMAIKGLALANQGKGRHIAVSAIEHQSILHSCKYLERFGFETSEIPVDSDGLIDPAVLEQTLRDDTVLVSVMHANNEVGTIQNMRELSQVVRKTKAVFHTDAVATAGMIKTDVGELGVDALSMSAQNFYGPKGAAALYLKQGTRIVPFLDGGIQEGGRRAGTENLPAIVGMGIAAEIAAARMEEWAERMKSLRDRLISGLLKMDHVRLTGHPEKRLPGTASVCIEYIEGESMLLMMSQQGVAASSGSACTSRALKASHVLLAMGIPHEIAHGSLLFSLGKDSAEADVDYVLEILPPVVERLREMSPLYRDRFEKRRVPS
jgi:cysteine desulfurase